MKPKTFLCSAGVAPLLALFLLSPAVHAVISDDEQSAVYIATQMAQDGPGDPADYMLYARSLARTLAQYTPEEQTDILGSAADGGGGGDTGGDTGGDLPSGGRPEVMDLFGQGLSTGDLKSALLSHSPLQAPELVAAINPDSHLSTGDLKAVLLGSIPLPTEILSMVADGTAELSSGDRQAVLDAQAAATGGGSGGDEDD